MILLPEIVWEELLLQFRRSRKKVEQVAFLEGAEFGDSSIVTSITFPDAVLRPGNFVVSAEAMSEAGQNLAPLVRLAQVHTHPGSWVGHSDFDDSWAYSHHDGAISIVVPNYGKEVTHLSDVAFHICRSRNWQQLSRSEAEQLVTLVPTIRDFRRKLW